MADKKEKDKPKEKAKRKPPRSDSQKLRDRKQIARLYLRGEYQADIAETLGLAQSTVCGDLAFLQKDWKESSLMDFNERKAMELAKIDLLEIEYWDAWKRSQEVYQVKTNEATQLLGSTQQKVSVREEKPVGEKRYLDGVQWCINKRCEILGLDAPKSVRQSIYEVNESTPRPVLRRIAAGMSADLAYAEFVSGKNEEKYGD